MEITKDDALKIIGRTDPRHEQFWANEREIVAAVNAAFEREHPGSQEIDENGTRFEQILSEASGKSAVDSGAIPFLLHPGGKI